MFDFNNKIREMFSIHPKSIRSTFFLATGKFRCKILRSIMEVVRQFAFSFTKEIDIKKTEGRKITVEPRMLSKNTYCVLSTYYVPSSFIYLFHLIFTKTL